MNLKTSYILIVCWLFVSCIQKKETKIAVANDNVTALIEVEEFLKLPSKDNYVLVDFRPPMDYQKGHIPNAINIWRPDIEDTSYPYKGMVASKTQLEQLLSEKGIKTSDTLIIYDDAGSFFATRLWWVLDYYGFNQTKILNGGLKNYVLHNQNLSTIAPNVKESDFTLNTPGTKNHIGLEELQKNIEDHKAFTLFDCRTENEYSGLRQKKGAKKAGRIPTSVPIDWNQNIVDEETHRFLSTEELKKLYKNPTTNEDDEIVVYCHSGVRSSHNAFILSQLLGFKKVRNYDGSWLEWSYHDLPYEKDVETEIFE